MTRRLAAIVLSCVLPFEVALGLSIDDQLKLVIEVYEIRPKECSTPPELVGSAAEVAAGELLFESKTLSGDRDISCSDCHLDRFGSADGLPLAVGVGGQGEGPDRYSHDGGTLVQRNALSLIGRSDKSFTSFFWDGKVQVVENQIVTQFGQQLPTTIESPLAGASMLPVIERDEFIGVSNSMMSNDIEKAVEDKLYFRRYLAVSKTIRQRLLEPTVEDDKNLADSLVSAGIDLSKFELAVVGNLIAKFIAVKFECQSSNWDKYVSGQTSALSVQQKRGAFLFYGKGRCAACHSGNYFSDFSFHSIGTPQGYFGPNSRRRDIGRAAVTHRVEDLYRFRTPPLVDVKATPPYGHNGALRTLREAVVHHFNPLQHYVDHADYREADFHRIGKLLDSRDSMLSTIDLDSDEDLAAILAFLEAL